MWPKVCIWLEHRLKLIEMIQHYFEGFLRLRRSLHYRAHTHANRYLLYIFTYMYIPRCSMTEYLPSRIYIYIYIYYIVYSNKYIHIIYTYIYFHLLYMYNICECFSVRSKYNSGCHDISAFFGHTEPCVGV